MGLRDAWHALRHGRAIELAIQEQDTSILSMPAERWDPYNWNRTWGLRAVDDLVATKGISVYREMMERDPQVLSCVQLPILARLASGWDFLPASESLEDAKAAEYTRRVLEQFVARLMSDAMDALPLCFACVEKVWAEPEESGEWRGYQGYRAFRALPQETVTFKRDEHGDIEPDGVWQTKSDAPGQMVAPSLDPTNFNQFAVDRFVLWHWRSKYGNPLGLSVLRPAYASYFFKQFTIKHWARYMERYGLPRARVRVPANSTKEQMEAAVEMLRRYQTDLAMAYRDNSTVEIDEPSTTATMNFEAAITAANKEIAHACLLPSTLLDNTEGGSYALAKAQKSTFTWVLDNIGALLSSEVMGNQVIRPLIDANFGPQYECPKFTFRDYSQPDLESIARMVVMLAEKGMDIPKSWIRETLGLPEVKDAADLLIVPQAAAVPTTDTEEEALDAVVAEYAAARATGDKDRALAALAGKPGR